MIAKMYLLFDPTREGDIMLNVGSFKIKLDSM